MTVSDQLLQSQRADLLALWRAVIDAANIEGKLAKFLPPVPKGKTVVIGGGKAAAAMARELDSVWAGQLSGSVVTPYGYGLPSYSGRIEILEAGHPVPDANGVRAADRMIELIGQLGPDDQVIALMSGGASALLVGLPPGVTLSQKQAITTQLLTSGASIAEMNLVRKQISTIKAGRLAQLAGPARVITLAVSDIPGDDLSAIGSGPTITDGARVAAARAVLSKYGIAVPQAVDRHLRIVEAEDHADVRRGDRAHLVVTASGSLEAAGKVAHEAGYSPIILGDDLEGEARELGAEHARMALSLLRENRRVCLLSGGETTVTVRGNGRGGRNCEYLLGFALQLDGRPGVAGLAADTDGIDGSEDNAGALVFASSLACAAARGINAGECLRNNDSYSFFAATGDLLVTGPTHTNVNDFRAVLVDPDADSCRQKASGGVA